MNQDGGDDLSKLIVTAYARYCVSNPLHPDVFPAIRKMEAEIVSMCLKMYRGPEGSAGVMTSGGTESIIMSIKTYRDWARRVKGITEPEMFVIQQKISRLSCCILFLRIIPSTAHAAFDKGASYLGIKVHTIPVNRFTRKVDVKHVKRAM